MLYIGLQVRVTSTELELLAVMGPLSRLDMTVAPQLYSPASEKVRGVNERVLIVRADSAILFLNHW